MLIECSTSEHFVVLQLTTFCSFWEVCKL